MVTRFRFSIGTGCLVSLSTSTQSGDRGHEAAQKQTSTAVDSTLGRPVTFFQQRASARTQSGKPTYRLHFEARLIVRNQTSSRPVCKQGTTRGTRDRHILTNGISIPEVCKRNQYLVTHRITPIELLNPNMTQK